MQAFREVHWGPIQDSLQQGKTVVVVLIPGDTEYDYFVHPQPPKDTAYERLLKHFALEAGVLAGVSTLLLQDAVVENQPCGVDSLRMFVEGLPAAARGSVKRPDTGGVIPLEQCAFVLDTAVRDMFISAVTFIPSDDYMNRGSYVPENLLLHNIKNKVTPTCAPPFETVNPHRLR